MKILDFLKKEAIISDLKAKDKKSTLEEMSVPISNLSGIPHNKIVRVLMEREQLGSTGIEGGIGIPHGKMESIDSIIMSFGINRKGIDFDSIDGLPSHIFCLILAPESSTGPHLKLLSQVSKILRSDDFKETLINSNDEEELFSIIKSVDEEF
ncbi:MAG: PTS sugar transporter subunit IIA [Desulfobacterales bacterium]|nr:PTS sugar transporter subunit IIA [Desulfobacterales bacterium]